MTTRSQKFGVIVPCWDSLRRDISQYDSFLSQLHDQHAGAGLLLLSEALSNASPLALRDEWHNSFIADCNLLSPARLTQLVDISYRFEQGQLIRVNNIPSHHEHSAPRFGFVVSNGYGLGHVMRQLALAAAFSPFGEVAFMSYSAGLTKSDAGSVLHLASSEYLELEGNDALSYIRETTRRFLNDFSPTHLIYDGNVIPDGLFAALASRPEIHLTWVRRGMWRDDVKPRFMAPQALVNLILEPGDWADEYDTGPTMRALDSFCPPQVFLKLAPIRPEYTMLDASAARAQLGLETGKKYALLMLGANRSHELTSYVVAQCLAANHTPVIAHWPISRSAPVTFEGAITIEQMPLAHLYAGFDLIISAAGYNSFHEVVAAQIPAIFIPQEDEGRDQQLARARYASDKGWAGLCREQDIHELADIINAQLARKSFLRSTRPWQQDWSEVLKLLHISADAKRKNMAKKTYAAQDIGRLFTQVFKRWKKRHTTGNSVFLLAFDIPAKTNMAKLLSRYPTNHIVVTNCLSPVQLRRLGYHYLYVNDAQTTLFAARRQFFNWLAIWKPKKIISLFA